MRAAIPVYDGTFAVMLSGGAASGKYPFAAVRKNMGGGAAGGRGNAVDEGEKEIADIFAEGGSGIRFHADMAVCLSYFGKRWLNRRFPIDRMKR